MREINHKLATGLIILLSTILSGLSVNAQSADVKKAIKHFELRNLSLAEKEIEQALTYAFEDSQEYSEALYFYFLIKSELRFDESSIEDNLEALPKLADAYIQCFENDKQSIYREELKMRMQQVDSHLETLSNQAFEQRAYLKYFYAKDHQLKLRETIGKRVGEDYESLASQAETLGFGSLGIKYWKHLIKVGYNDEHAYKKLISSFHKIKKYEQVDKLLAEAKAKYPYSNQFAATEMLRLLEKDMTFSALQLGKRSIQNDPQNIEVRFLLGLVHSKLNEHRPALEHFLKVHEENADHPYVNLELGKHFYKFSNQYGHLEKARGFLEKAYMLNPRDTTAKMLLHDVYVELGQNSQAMLLSKK